MTTQSLTEQAEVLERAAEIMARNCEDLITRVLRRRADHLRAQAARQADPIEAAACAWASTVQYREPILAILRARFGPWREALEKIACWHGEFPQAVFDGRPCSYGVAYGSNGERDYMREVARRALAGDAEKEKT